MDIKNKKILIVGFGRSGRAAARYCIDHGANVTVTDAKSADSFDLSGYPKQLRAYFGSHPLHIFEEADVIIPSPGISLETDGMKAARAKGIRVVGEMELVLSEIRAPIIAITGTNGKSTVTTLIGEILKEAGRNVLVGGNLGTPLIDMLNEKSGGSDVDFIVLEVSSYQLEISPNLHPHVAVVLNITPDHLDRYANFEEYVAAKELLIKNTTKDDYFVFNQGDPLVADMTLKTPAKRVPFSLRNSPDSVVVLPRSRKTIDLGRAKLVGAHNKENMMAAAFACDELQISSTSIQNVFDRFKGLPHRNQFVEEINGVRYFDDSKGTNVGAVVKSLEGFASKVILIAGGLDKGGSYSPLRSLVKEKVKGLILIGAAADKIASELGDLTKVVKADSMASAVKFAAAVAEPGDVVLLSPACASFDMFKDYADRGNKFVEEVRKIGG